MAVTIVWIKQAILATVKLYIVMGHDMNRTAESARLFTRERPFNSSTNCHPCKFKWLSIPLQ